MAQDLKLDWLTPHLLTYLIGRSKNSQSRSDYLTNAKRWRGWYSGKTFLAPVKEYDDMSVDEHNATARRNIIGETVDGLSSMLLKNSPVIRRIPYRAEWAKLADDIDALWHWQWIESYGRTVFRSLLEDCQITGLAGGKIYWDPSNQNRAFEGGVVIKSVPMENLLVDPMATNDHHAQDVSFIAQHMKRYPEEIVAKYGEPAEKALGFKMGSGNMKSPRAYPMLSMTNEEVTRNISGGRLYPNYIPELSAIGDDDKGKVDLYEVWLFPDRLYGAELSTGDKTPESFRFGLVATMVEDRIIRVRTNPFVRRMRIQSKNDLGQESMKQEYLGHGTHPFVFMHWRRVSDKHGNRKFYDCMSMVEWMVSMQFNVNALRRNMAIILRTIANPMILYNKEALATPVNKIVCAPGQMLEVRGRFRLQEALQLLRPEQMPPQVGEMIAGDIEGIRNAGGVKPGVMGLFPAPGGGTSHTPGETIGTLQEAAFGPLWKYVQSIEACLGDTARIYDGLMQQFFKPGHYMAVTRRGDAAEVEWTGQHRIAQFRRIVVSGATTPIYDIQREEREAFVKRMVDEALLGGDLRILRTTLIYVDHMNFPWTGDYLEVLQEEIMEVTEREEELKRIGAAQLASGQAAPLQLPPASGEQPGAPLNQGSSQFDLQELAADMGVTPEQLALAALG